MEQVIFSRAYKRCSGLETILVNNAVVLFLDAFAFGETIMFLLFQQECKHSFLH